jgi:hypothetical protein
MKLMEIVKLPGTFAGVRFDEQTMDAIEKYIKDNNIPNPIPRNELHITLLYSKKHLPNYKPLGIVDEKATPDKLTVFKTSDKDKDDTNCLVLLVKCPFLTKRFDTLMDEHKATYDFDEYLPHTTLSYDIGDYDYSKAEQFPSDLHIIKEYKETLS